VPAFSARYPKSGKNVATFPENLQKTVKLQFQIYKGFMEDRNKYLDAM